MQKGQPESQPKRMKRKWWPRAELNHRHTDFRSTGILLFILLISIRNHEIDSGTDCFGAHFDRRCHYGYGGIGDGDYRAPLK